MRSFRLVLLGIVCLYASIGVADRPIYPLVPAGHYLGKLCFKVNTSFNSRSDLSIYVWLKRPNGNYTNRMYTGCQYDNWIAGEMETTTPSVCVINFYGQEEDKNLDIKLRATLTADGTSRVELEGTTYQYTMKDAVKKSTINMSVNEITGTSLNFKISPGKGNYDCRNALGHYQNRTYLIPNTHRNTK